MALVRPQQLFVLTAVVSFGYVVYGGWTAARYDRIGVRSLSAFAVLWGANFVVCSVVIYLLLEAGVTGSAGLAGLSFPEPVELFFIASTPVRGALTVAAIFSWFWFVYVYTTRARRRDKLIIVGLSLVLVVVTTLSGLVGALATFGYARLPAVLSGEFFRFVSLLEILGTGVGIGVGAAQLFKTAGRHPPFARAAAVGLTLPVVVPYLLRYLYQFRVVASFGTLGLLRLVGFTAGLVGLVLAVERYGLFDQLPAAQAVGRTTSFDAVNTAIAVLNDDDVISDLNGAAERLFDTTAAASIGEPVDHLLPATVGAIPTETQRSVTFEVPGTGKVVEAEATGMTDDRGAGIGRVVVFKDITEQRRRQQRIQVLNRVLRHNLRNDLTVVNGRIEVLGRDRETDQATVETAQSKIRDLISLGAKARDIEELLDADREVETPLPVAEVVSMALSDVDTGDRTVRTDLTAEMRTRANPHVFGSVIAELVTNAIEHTSGEVAVVAAPRLNGIVVSDTGSGLPGKEIEVFTTGQETPLKHSDGLGLWLVKWGVARLGGSIEFDSGEGGTDVTVTLPDELITTGTATADAADARAGGTATTSDHERATDGGGAPDG